MRSLRAGLGPDFEVSQAANKKAIHNLPAHRSALLTGWRAADVRVPGRTDRDRIQADLQRQNTELTQPLKSSEATARE